MIKYALLSTWEALRTCGQEANSGYRWSIESGMHTSHKDAGFEACAEEHYGQCYMSRDLPIKNDEFWTR